MRRRDPRARRAAQLAPAALLYCVRSRPWGAWWARRPGCTQREGDAVRKRVGLVLTSVALLVALGLPASVSADLQVGVQLATAWKPPVNAGGFGPRSTSTPRRPVW